MRSLKVLVVEDETLIAEVISLYLKERGHEMIGNPISYDDAISSFQFMEPDVVLLDIRLYGEKSGIDVGNYLKKVKPNLPLVYLTSQHDKIHVNKALESSPAGYLTKPIQKQTLWTTVETSFHCSLQGNGKEENIVIHDGKKNHCVSKDSILYIQSSHVYIDIFLDDGTKITARHSLSSFLEKLDDQRFTQCHRSFVVNTFHVDSWDKHKLFIKSTKIPMSRSKRFLIEDRIKKQ